MVQFSSIEVSVVMSVMTVVISSCLGSPVGEETASRTKRSHRAREHVGGSSHNTGQYTMWLCPSVVCTPVSATCKDVEAIVFEYSFYNRNGRRVDVRCESCSYCLDRPSRYNRNRRSIDTIFNTGLNVHSTKRCPASLICPSIPNVCESVKMTNVLLQGQHCRRCPACFDGTLLNMLA